MQWIRCVLETLWFPIVLVIVIQVHAGPSVDDQCDNCDLQPFIQSDEPHVSFYVHLIFILSFMDPFASDTCVSPY